MSSKYNPPRDRYLSKCTFPGCDSPRVKCHKKMDDGKECGRYGHPDSYKNSETTLMTQVKHSHFLPSNDIGRNVFHEQGVEFKAPESMKVYTWRTPRGKNRWRKIPKEVKDNLGWK